MHEGFKRILKGRRIRIGDGKSTDFWRDQWCGSMILSDKFPDLFDTCREQSGSVFDFAKRGWRLSFRRWLNESLQIQDRRLRDMLASVALSDEPDSPIWVRCGKKNGKFSVKSTYMHLCCDLTEDPNKRIWKAKVPLKIKIFLWLSQQMLFSQKIICPKETGEDMQCCFCSAQETLLHLFFRLSNSKIYMEPSGSCCGGCL